MTEGKDLSKQSIRILLALGPAAANPSFVSNKKELRAALLDFIADFADWDQSHAS